MLSSDALAHPASNESDHHNPTPEFCDEIYLKILTTGLMLIHFAVL
jgi:hypothetical protein